MSTTTSNGKSLMEAVKKMKAEEFDAFLGEALSARAVKKPVLSPQETKLIKRINRGLPKSTFKDPRSSGSA